MSCEILAPAGSHESLVAAVRSGADAVYLGMDKFNARRSAANFDDRSFREAVNFCHTRGVKVYLALNTLVSDSEIGDALDCVRIACEAGADAVIVQDLGLARLIHESAPELRLHASTQMSVHSPSALKALKRMGFSRVVLARELSADNIKQMTDAASELGIETEVFVHGALCMCLSGQCYLSSMIGTRSGNRGMCAQPCRLAFSDGEYPLSLRDLSLIDYVGELESMGVASLKIEGRMKRAEYVAAAVNAFRNKRDTAADIDGAKELLAQVFGRSGHTDGYFTAKLGKDMFGTRTQADVEASADVIKKTHELYRNEYRHIPVALNLRVKRNEASVLTISDGVHTAKAVAQAPEEAVNRSLNADYAEKMCCKLGSTPFTAAEFACEIDDGITLSSATINALRRNACDELMRMRAPERKVFFQPSIPTASKKPNKNPRIFARFANAKQVPDNLNGVDRVYLPLGESFEGIESAQLGVEIPRALFCGESKVAQQLAALPKNVGFALCNNLAATQLAKEAGLSVHAGFGMNIFNSASANEAASFADEITLSFELNMAQASSIAKGGIIAYGKLPLMLTRNCIRGGKRDCASCPHELVDRKQAHFPIVCHDGFSELLNCVPLCLDYNSDKLDSYDFIELYFTDETKSRCAEIIAAFTQRTAPKGNFTRGLYRRGVL